MDYVMAQGYKPMSWGRMLLVLLWLQTQTLVIKYSFLEWTWFLQFQDFLSSFKEDSSQYLCALQLLIYSNCKAQRLNTF